jgi:hypothetical protein
MDNYEISLSGLRGARWSPCTALLRSALNEGWFSLASPPCNSDSMNPTPKQTVAPRDFLLCGFRGRLALIGVLALYLTIGLSNQPRSELRGSPRRPAGLVAG